MADEDYLKVKNYALKLLAFRPRSVFEVRNKLSSYLKKKNLPENLEDKVILDLQKLNFLSDVDFAAWWIDQRKKNSIRGNKIVKLELRAKGLSSDLINEVLASGSKDEELNKALKIIEKHIVRLPKNLSAFNLKIKLNNLLLRRGFEYEIIKNAIDLCLKKR